jgi:hypothetical protein
MEKTVKNCTICNQVGQSRCPEHTIVDHFEQKFYEFEHSDNVIKLDSDQYTTQCTQYTWKMTKNELASYFYKEYYRLDFPDKEVLLTIRPEKITIKNISTGETEEVESDGGFTSITTSKNDHMEYAVGNQKFDERVEELYNEIIQDFDYVADYNISEDDQQTIITDIVHAIIYREQKNKQ